MARTTALAKAIRSVAAGQAPGESLEAFTARARAAGEQFQQAIEAGDDSEMPLPPSRDRIVSQVDHAAVAEFRDAHIADIAQANEKAKKLLIGFGATLATAGLTVASGGAAAPALIAAAQGIIDQLPGIFGLPDNDTEPELA